MAGRLDLLDGYREDPHPADGQPGHTTTTSPLTQQLGAALQPGLDVAVATLRDPMFRTRIGERLVRATSGHAFYAQEHLGNNALEPGPHALLILSAEPRLNNAGRIAATGTAVASARMFHLGEADDLPTMLDDMATIVQRTVEQARTDHRLLAYLSDEQRLHLARRVQPDGLFDTATAAFPYLAALWHGLLWDPRTPQLGLASTSDKPLSTETTYCGVAVTTLDTRHAPWAAIKRRYAGAKDPVKGLPLTPAHVPAHGWAVLEDGIAVAVERTATQGLAEKSHVITANRTLAATIDSRGEVTYDRDLRMKPPPMFGERDLWTHLNALHKQLRAAFGYRTLP